MPVAMGAAILAGDAAAFTFHSMLGRAIEKLGQQESQLVQLKKQADQSREASEKATALLAELKGKIAADEAQSQALREHIEAFAKQAAACAEVKRVSPHGAGSRR